MREKVLVLGNKGMLGHVLFRTLKSKINREKYEVIGVNRSKNQSDVSSYNLDVLDFEILEKFIIDNEPKYVVNCVGTLVESSVKEPSLAIKTNALLPHFLNEISEKYGFKLVHISTDCVFNGKKGMYKEYDHKSEINYYGLTKNLGEINNHTNLTIRTSIIGPELKKNPTGLFCWIISQKGKRIKGYSKAIWSGLTTIELSKFIVWSLDEKLTGIIHATNGIGISKYDLIEIINEVFNLEITLVEDKSYKVDKSLLNTRVKHYHFPSYYQMIEELNEWICREIG